MCLVVGRQGMNWGGEKTSGSACQGRHTATCLKQSIWLTPWMSAFSQEHTDECPTWLTSSVDESGSVNTIFSSPGFWPAVLLSGSTAIRNTPLPGWLAGQL